MAVIALSGTQLNYSVGIGAFDGLNTAFTNIKRTSSSLKDALGTLNLKLGIASVFTSVGTAQEEVQKAETCESEKQSALSLAYDKLDALIMDTAVVDQKVSDVILSREDDFYKRYYYLKPDSKKDLLERVGDFCGDVWDGLCSIGNALLNFGRGLVEWCKKHWKAIATIGIVIGAILLIGVGGPVGAAAVGALLGAGGGGLLGGIMSAATGHSFWEGFENGAFSGAIAGAITGAMGFGFVGNSGASLSFWQTVATGAVSSAGASILSDLGDRFIKGENISFGDMLINTLFSAGSGALFSAVGYGAGKAFTAVKQRLFPTKNIQNAPYIKDGKPNGRPNPTGKAKEQFLKDLYNKQVGSDGVLRDPHTGKVIPWKPGEPMKNIVDVGHKTGKEYIKAFAKYQQGKWSLDKLKAFQSNINNFQLEDFSTNRGHAFEGSSLFDFLKNSGLPWMGVFSDSILGGSGR